jgi:hypothetical protein
MDVNESETGGEGKLKVTLTAFDPKKQQGRIKIEELSEHRGRYYVTVKFGQKGENRIDYKTWDVHKTSDYRITTSVSNDSVESIEITFVGTEG